MSRAFLPVVLLLCAACGSPADGDEPTCGLAPVVFDSRGTIQGESGGDCARVEREPEDLPEDTICFACPYLLHRVIVVRGGAGFDVADPARLEYEPTHHNWADVARARLDDGRTAEVVFRYTAFGPMSSAEGWELELSFVDEGGALVDGPVLLTLLGASP